MLRHSFLRLAKEPPLRLLVRCALKSLPVSVQTRALWDLSPHPAYLLGILTGALQAQKQKETEISVIEFGVAGGTGLLAMQAEAASVEKETGVGVRVYGFDMGPGGLPPLIGDYRDHPDRWKAGDYPMDEPALRSHLTRRTNLIIGNVADTVPEFFRKFEAPPVGFVAIDLDLYSSTRDALELFRSPGRRMLSHVPMYFDDIDTIYSHRFAGELLAIEEFNLRNRHVKIDRWHGLRDGRPFPEQPFLEKLFVAHDLEALTRATTSPRDVAVSPLRDVRRYPEARRAHRRNGRTRPSHESEPDGYE